MNTNTQAYHWLRWIQQEFKESDEEEDLPMEVDEKAAQGEAEEPAQHLLRVMAPPAGGSHAHVRVNSSEQSLQPGPARDRQQSPKCQVPERAFDHQPTLHLETHLKG